MLKNVRLLLAFAALLALVWAGSVATCLPRAENRLQLASISALQLPGREEKFKKVEVVAVGQTLELRGEVAEETDLQEALRIVRATVSTDSLAPFARGKNPVREVDASRLSIPPKPPGWCLLAIEPDRILLTGQAAQPEEKEALLEKIRTRFSHLPLEDTTTTTDKVRAAVDLSLTLKTFPSPRPAGLENGRLFLARLGGGWENLPAESATAALTALTAGPARASAVLDGFLPRQAVRQRDLALPAPWVVLGAFGGELHLRGEVRDEALRTALVTATRNAAGGRLVTDAIRLSSGRRPVTVAGATASLPALPPAGAPGALGFARVGEAWTLRPVTSAIDAAPLATTLPELGLLQPGPDLAPALAEYDAIMPALRAHFSRLGPAAGPPAHLVLAVLGRRVLLRGTLPDEGLKAALLTAVQARYLDREIVDAITLSQTVAPAESLGQTITLPSAAPEQLPGLLAIATPGQPWQRLSLPPQWTGLADSAALASSGLLPAGLPPSQAWPDVAALLPELLARTASFTPPAPVLPPPYFTLAIWGREVHLLGWLPDAELKAKAAAAARSFYKGCEVFDEITLSDKLAPAPPIGPTLIKLPPPPADAGAPALLAFALPGTGWRTLSLDTLPGFPDGQPEPGALLSTSLMPQGFDPARPLTDFSSLWSALLQHASRRPVPAR